MTINKTTKDAAWNELSTRHLAWMTEESRAIAQVLSSDLMGRLDIKFRLELEMLWNGLTPRCGFQVGECYFSISSLEKGTISLRASSRPYGATVKSDDELEWLIESAGQPKPIPEHIDLVQQIYLLYLSKTTDDTKALKQAFASADAFIKGVRPQVEHKWIRLLDLIAQDAAEPSPSLPTPSPSAPAQFTLQEMDF